MTAQIATTGCEDPVAERDATGFVRRRYRAPQDDGAALVEPDWPGLTNLARTNRGELATRAAGLLGFDLGEFAAQAQSETLAVAHEYTSSFSDVPAPAASAPLIVSGHQPELFHPGVWFKNFSLAELSRSLGGVGLHLIIDSDLCRSAAVRVPSGPIDAPRVQSVPLDQAIGPTPYEERRVLSEAVLAGFGESVAEALDGLVANPLADAMTADLVEAARRTGNLGLALSQARRLVEARWGGATLEAPLSAVCETPSFARFLGVLLDDPAGLRSAYNGALAEYRRAHRLRSDAQPLPDLAADGDWLETPFWVWTTDDPTRRPLYARRSPDGLQLTSRGGDEWLAEDPRDPEQWSALRGRGVKVRSRALVTTLYARLALADLFLHGIGGAKYDEATDEFSRRLLGFSPPPHATLTATVRLPVDRPHVDPGADARLRRELREMRYHPETIIDSPSEATRRLIEEKRLAIATPKTPANAQERHRRIESANAALQAALESRRRSVLDEREALAARQQAAQALGSREYSFCLYPEEQVCGTLRRLASPS